MNSKRPLVTFALFSYNQEEYISEAVSAALAQTYEPLEVIISDDGSTDGTYATIEALVTSYSGPHRVRLNRNSSNLGVGAHVAKVHSMALGELVIHAAGDDISLPHRAARIVQAYQSTMQKPSVIESNAQLIDSTGRELGLYHPSRAAGHYQSSDPWERTTAGGGATYAVSREMLDAFAPIPDSLLAEDVLLVVRANLLRGVLYLPEPLLCYRVWDRGLWNGMNSTKLTDAQIVSNEAKWTRYRSLVAQQALEDVAGLQTAERITGATARNAITHLRRAQRELTIWHELLAQDFGRSSRALMVGLLNHQYITPTRWIRMFGLRWVGPLLGSRRRSV